MPPVGGHETLREVVAGERLPVDRRGALRLVDIEGVRRDHGDERRVLADRPLDPRPPGRSVPEVMHPAQFGRVRRDDPVEAERLEALPRREASRSLDDARGERVRGGLEAWRGIGRAACDGNERNKGASGEERHRGRGRRSPKVATCRGRGNALCRAIGREQPRSLSRL